MNAPHVPLSILDLVSISEGMTTREAINASMEGAQAADRLGYERLWFAEHHNTNSLASSATALLIDRAASLTERIRVGSGGIMLPNHSPLAVIEQFGTLVEFHGIRIDLGLGRVPGTDQLTAQLLARTSAEPAAFIAAVEQMRDWSRRGARRLAAHHRRRGARHRGADVDPGRPPTAPVSPRSWACPSPSPPTSRPSSTCTRWRSTATSTPTPSSPRSPRHAPWSGLNLASPETDEEAQRQFTTLQQMIMGVVTGQRQKHPAAAPDRGGRSGAPRLPDRSAPWSIKAVGSPATVVRELEET